MTDRQFVNYIAGMDDPLNPTLDQDMADALAADAPRQAHNWIHKARDIRDAREES